MTIAAPGLGLYVHVPFCRTLCGYCDFYSRVLDPAAVAPFIDSVLRELDNHAARRALRCDTIYVGGGTPTVLPVAELARLLGGLRNRVESAADLEFTVEANPATISDDIAAVLAAAGVSRVSLGAQSFAPAELQMLERGHRREQVGETVAQCQRAGIRQISLDLMFGIPGQTLGSWLRSLCAALALAPDHLSCYSLTYEPGTPLAERLAAGQIQRLDEDLEADMFEAVLDLLPAAGLAHYEISNFARPGAACRHNLHYWHNEPYLGLGPAAAGFIDEVRYRNIPDLAAYVQAVQQGTSPWSEQERLPPERRARETAMLELRLTAGIDRKRFTERFGRDPVELFTEAIARHATDGLLSVDASRIRLTRAGILVADRVSSDFV